MRGTIIMDPQYSQLILAKALLPELNNSARDSRREAREMGQHVAAGLGDLLIAVGRRLQGPEPARRGAEPQQRPA